MERRNIETKEDRKDNKIRERANERTQPSYLVSVQ